MKVNIWNKGDCGKGGKEEDRGGVLKQSSYSTVPHTINILHIFKKLN